MEFSSGSWEGRGGEGREKREGRVKERTKTRHHNVTRYWLQPDHTHLSDVLEHFVIDGILELHAAVERVGLVVLHQLCEAVEGRGADGVLVSLHLDTTVPYLSLCSEGDNRDT